jgi:hypothetical protein
MTEIQLEVVAIDLDKTKRLEQLESEFETVRNSWIKGSLIMMEIRDNGLYEPKYGLNNFQKYCRDRWGMGKSYVNYLIAGGRVVQNLTTIGGQIEITEKVPRELTDVKEPEHQRTIWQRAADKAKELKKKITAKLVKQTKHEWRVERDAEYAERTKPKEVAKPMCKMDASQSSKILRKTISIKIDHFLRQENDKVTAARVAIEELQNFLSKREPKSAYKPEERDAETVKPEQNAKPDFSFLTDDNFKLKDSRDIAHKVVELMCSISMSCHYYMDSLDIIEDKLGKMRVGNFSDSRKGQEVAR